MTAALLSLLLLLGAGQAYALPNDRPFWEVRIELTEEAVRSLSAEPRKPVNGRVYFYEKSVEARVKLKGHGSFQPLNQKPSFTLHFDRALAGEIPFAGSKVYLNNSVEDPTCLKEKIGAELFSRAGIAVPRVAHARVTLNERELGLYVLKEGFSAEFVQRSFADKEGTIYDSDSSNPKEGGGMDVDAGEGARGQIRLQELWSAASEPELKMRFERLQEVLDVEEFVRFVAMEVLLCHWDGYALRENNFRIYVPDHGKIQFLPSGMDQIFAKADLAWKPRFSGMIARALMETEPGEELFRAAFNSLLEQVLDVQEISNRLNVVVRELSPHLTSAEIGTIRTGAKELIAGIAARRESLRAQNRADDLAVIKFKDAKAVIHLWEPVNEPVGGRMTRTASNLVIHAGPKTSASWRATVRLLPGRYSFTSEVETRGLLPLPFGNRQGACLRVLGKNTQSESAMGTTRRLLACEFEVSGEEPVTLLCEVRAAGGQVQFATPVQIVQMRVK
jgi:hypothetical protein